LAEMVYGIEYHLNLAETLYLTNFKKEKNIINPKSIKIKLQNNIIYLNYFTN